MLDITKIMKYLKETNEDAYNEMIKLKYIKKEQIKNARS